MDKYIEKPTFGEMDDAAFSAEFDSFGKKIQNWPQVKEFLERLLSPTLRRELAEIDSVYVSIVRHGHGFIIRFRKGMRDYNLECSLSQGKIRTSRSEKFPCTLENLKHAIELELGDLCLSKTTKRLTSGEHHYEKDDFGKRVPTFSQLKIEKLSLKNAEEISALSGIDIDDHPAVIDKIRARHKDRMEHSFAHENDGISEDI